MNELAPKEIWPELLDQIGLKIYDRILEIWQGSGYGGWVGEEGSMFD